MKNIRSVTAGLFRRIDLTFCKILRSVQLRPNQYFDEMGVLTQQMTTQKF